MLHFYICKISKKVYVIGGIEENVKLIVARQVPNVFAYTADVCSPDSS